jgi:hypothetical protein
LSLLLLLLLLQVVHREAQREAADVARRDEHKHELLTFVDLSMVAAVVCCCAGCPP